MTILKLQNEGDTHTGRIKACGEVAGNFGPQVKFTFENGDDLFLPKDSADRQLQRIPLGYTECVGEWLTFSRDPNAKARSKPYWGIKVADIVDKSRPAEPKRISYAEANASNPTAPSVGGPIKGLDYEEGGPPEDESPYEEPGPLPAFHKPPMTAKPAEVAPVATEKAKIVRAYLDLFAWMKSQPEMKDVDADVVQKASATIWIEWNKRGLVR